MTASLSTGRRIAQFTFCSLLGWTAYAAETTTTVTSNDALPPTPAATATSLMTDIPAPRFGDFTLNAGIKSTNSTGRVYEMQSESGRRYKLKNEYYAGFSHQSGWGLSGMAITSGASYGDSNTTAFGAGDPSVTLVHPAFYNDGTLKVWGQARRYFPVADRSQDRNQRQYAYYIMASYKMPANWTAFNQLTARYFDQSYYKDSDTTYMTEDIASLLQKVNVWFKYGVGQHTQVEWHRQTATGTSVEIYPMLNFVLNANAFIETRLRLPVYKVNAVYDTPTNVSLKNAQAELFAQISI